MSKNIVSFIVILVIIFLVLVQFFPEQMWRLTGIIWLVFLAVTIIPGIIIVALDEKGFFNKRKKSI